MVNLNIFKFLIPTEHKFFEMLREQAENSLHGTLIFKKFVNKFPELTEEEKKQYVTKIKRIEHTGDIIIHTMVAKMNQTFITPIDREDIHQLTVLLDDVLDITYGTADQIVRYKVKKMNPYIKKLTELIVLGMKQIEMEIKELKNLKTSRTHFIKIHQLENEGDEVFHKAIADLFAREKNAIELVKLKDVYQNLELVTDKIEDVAVVIENIVIKHA